MIGKGEMIFEIQEVLIYAGVAVLISIGIFVAVLLIMSVIQ